MGMEGDLEGKPCESTGTARPRRRRRLLILLVLTVAGIFLYRVLQPRPPVIEAVTPDGKFKIRFIAGGVGKIDHHPDSKLYVWFYEVARGWAPVVLFKELPRPQNVSLPGQLTNHGADRLMVTFNAERVDGPKPNDLMQRVFEDVAFEFDESTGYSWEQSWSQESIGPGHTLSFDRFPRRDALIRCRLVEKSTKRTLMSFSIPNDKPSSVEFDQAPGAPPMTLTSPELKCTLKELAAPGEGESLSPVFAVETLDKAWTEHKTTSELEDATGNRGLGLSPFEKAWKARVGVYRTENAVFAPSEGWQSPAFAVPEEGSAVTLDHKGKLGPTALKVLCVKGPGLGQVEETNGQWRFSTQNTSSAVQLPSPGGNPKHFAYYNIDMPHTERPFVVLDLDDLDPEDHVVVIVRDQDGATLWKAFDRGTRFLRTRCRSVVEFVPRSTTEEVTVTVIISRPQVFEFYVAPPGELRSKAVNRK
jgi:hypothetical protein